MELKLNFTIDPYKIDLSLIYNIWFKENDERLESFRSILRSVKQIIDGFRYNTFGNVFKISHFEFALKCITIQKQIFDSGAHSFCRKPKLRIPNIYENTANKKSFMQFLENCFLVRSNEQIITEKNQLVELKIKGFNHAVSSVIYCFRQIIIPSFNNTILNSYNLLFDDIKKLGSCPDYLKIQGIIVYTNSKYKNSLLVDLGSKSRILFVIGNNKINLDNVIFLSSNDCINLVNIIIKRQKEISQNSNEESLHNEMQFHYLRIGNALDYGVLSAINNRSKSFNGNNFYFECCYQFTVMQTDNGLLTTIKLIDLIWFQESTNKLLCVFEVEKSASIYSGILRLMNLSSTISGSEEACCIVIPFESEKELKIQLERPSIKNYNIKIKYILFSDLRKNHDAFSTFGNNHNAI